MPLEIKNITKTYPDPKGNTFSVHIDFSVADGETLVLAGHSGCGKTTALSIIAGLIAAESGSIVSDGTDLTNLPAWKRHIALVFQDSALFPNMDAGKNIAYSLFIRGVKKETRRRIVEETLSAVHLPSSFARRRIHTLSGGERQRIAIARALASSPRALLMDEPFSSLDSPLRRELWKEFAGFKGAIPCVFVTHDQEEAAALGDRIALMSDGHIVEIEKTRDMFLNPQTEIAAKFFRKEA
jgi:putative spermidine/putrescine transport system ATP-binding protein